jgi:hypothetical protein
LLTASRYSSWGDCSWEGISSSHSIKSCVTNCASLQHRPDLTVCTYQKDVNNNKIFCECTSKDTDCFQDLGTYVNVVVETHIGECLGGACFSITKTTAPRTTKRLALAVPCSS